jgi:hypothetical protein
MTGTAIPSAYRFDNSRIRVEWRGDNDWAVTDTGLCLNNSGEWEYEPPPSSRSEDFLTRCRFSLEEAIKRASTEVKP